MTNPCINCDHQWSAGRNCDCTVNCGELRDFKETEDKLWERQKLARTLRDYYDCPPNTECSLTTENDLKRFCAKCWEQWANQ
jgi:hypothetical protein